MTIASTSAGIVARPAPVAEGDCDFVTSTLSVQLTGNGSGTWKTTNSAYVPNNRINCEMVNGVKTPTSDCTEVYGTQDPTATQITIYYTVTPATGSEACAAGYCDDQAIGSSFVLTASRGISASFALLPYQVTVTKTGTGTGTVTTLSPGIACGTTCAASYLYGTALGIAAVPDAGAVFSGWTGTCAGQNAECNFSVLGTTSINAVFGLFVPTPSPPAPTATPKVTSRPAATPRVTVTPTTAPATAGTGATPGPVASEATSTDEVPASAPAASQSAETPGASATPGQTEPPIVTAGGSADFTPIVLAILGAGLLIALGIGFAAYMLRRRSAPPS